MAAWCLMYLYMYVVYGESYPGPQTFCNLMKQVAVIACLLRHHRYYRNALIEEGNGKEIERGSEKIQKGSGWIRDSQVRNNGLSKSAN